MIKDFWFWFAVIAGFSMLLTGVIRFYALSRSLIDVPNARSSHSVPTPRGGGIGIVISFLLVVILSANANQMPWDFALALLGAGACTALLGFLDDHGHIAARWRLLGHFAAAAWALYWLDGLPAVDIFGISLEMGAAGYLIAAFYLVWLLNLYNFMDGIDGIASVEAVCVCIGGAVLFLLVDQSDAAWIPISLAAAVIGFLVWNFPPAKIFMGDAGSGFLGVILGIMSIKAAWVAPQLLWGWLILLGVFIVDATLTLLRRLCRGEKIYEAHRSHAYQYASRQFGRHLPVTAGVLFINVIWLLPIAVSVALGAVEGLAGVFIAYVPLFLLALKYKAGELEKQ